MQETFRTTPELSSPFIDEQLHLMEGQFVQRATVAYEVGPLAVVETSETIVSRRTREAAVRDIGEQHWDSYSPFSEETTVFGPEREAAIETVTAIADQSRLTGKYVDGRHKALARRLEAGEITKAEHDDSVGRILSGFVQSNPQHLRNVEAAQAKVIARRVKAGVLPEDTQFVNLTSRVTETGDVELAGIDAIVARMTGCNTQADLAARALELKKMFYGEEAYAKAVARHEKNQGELLRAAIAKAQDRHETIMHILELDEAKKKATAKAKKEDKFGLAA